MRVQGFADTQITEATGVPGSTIARWAAAEGWRVRDLVEDTELTEPAAPPAGLFARRDPYGASEAGDETGFVLPGAVGEAAGEAEDTSPRARRERMETALTRAAMAAETAIGRGSLKQAEQAARLAGSLNRTIEKLGEAPPDEDARGVFYSAEQIAEARADLVRRFDRLADQQKSVVEGDRERYMKGVMKDPGMERWEVDWVVKWAPEGLAGGYTRGAL